MEEMLKPGWIRCPECNHIQKDGDICKYCGTSLAKVIRIKELEQRLQEAEQKIKDTEHKIPESSSEGTRKYEPSHKQITINRLMLSIFALIFMLPIVAGFLLNSAAQLAEREQLRIEAEKKPKLECECEEYILNYQEITDIMIKWGDSAEYHFRNNDFYQANESAKRVTEASALLEDIETLYYILCPCRSRHGEIQSYLSAEQVGKLKYLNWRLERLTQ